MTRRLPTPAVALCALILALTFSPETYAKTPKKPAKAKAASASQKKAGRDAKSRRDAKSAREKPSKNKRKEVAREKNGKGGKAKERARAKREDERRSRASRNAKTGRREATRVLSRGELKKLSPRQRRAHLAEQSRRRREAAERARRAAIARALYLARIRAQDQAFRDETRSNILRDETTGEDLEIRRVAIEALGNHAGSVVVMDPKSGRVYTVVNQDWALRKGFKPCSTVKLVTGLAGLSDNVIDPAQTVKVSTSSLDIDLTDSLAYSNNTYFQQVGGHVGFDRMMFYARKFGFGQQTGINHAGEISGRLPAIKEGFAVKRMSSHGDDIEVTPIQLANMASAIANGGKLLVPHLPRTPKEDVKFEREVRADLDVPQDHLRRLLPGMIGAVNYGSGRTAHDRAQTIAGKTGTCISQDEYRTWLGLFTSFAPVHDPKLAVAVVTRGSSERGKIAAGIAGKIYRGLSHRFGAPGSTPALLADENLAPRPKVDPSKAAELDGEEAEVEAELNAQTEALEAGAEEDATSAAPIAPQSNVRSTAKIYEKPKAAAAPAMKREQSAPVASKPSAANASPVSEASGAGRPRRVNPEDEK